MWTAKNDYLTTTEMDNNAREIYTIMAADGWTLNAIAAMLGNMWRESGVNPGSGRIVK